MWINEKKDNKGFEPHPEGSYPATCVDIFEFTKENTNFNKPKPFKNDKGEYEIDTRPTITSVCVSFMTSEEMMLDGKMVPRYVSFWAPKTWHEKGNLRKFVAGWIPAFAADDNFDEEQLIGAHALVNVVRYVNSGGYEKAKIVGAMQVPKMMEHLCPAIPSDFVRHNDKQPHDGV